MLAVQTDHCEPANAASKAASQAEPFKQAVCISADDSRCLQEVYDVSKKKPFSNTSLRSRSLLQFLVNDRTKPM